MTVTVPRFCPLEVPPTLCSRGCDMGPCVRAVQGLQADVITQNGTTVDGRPYTVNHTAFAELAKLANGPAQNPVAHCGRCGFWLPDPLVNREVVCCCTGDELSRFMADILVPAYFNTPEVQKRYADAAEEWAAGMIRSIKLIPVLPGPGECPTPGCPELEDGNTPTGQCMECVGEAYAEAERFDEMERQATEDDE